MPRVPPDALSLPGLLRYLDNLRRLPENPDRVLPEFRKDAIPPRAGKEYLRRFPIKARPLSPRNPAVVLDTAEET